MRFNEITDKTDELNYLVHLMTTGKISIVEGMGMVEASTIHQNHRLLIENVNQNSVNFFCGLGGIKPVIGGDYWYIMFMIINDRVQIFDSQFNSQYSDSAATKCLLINIADDSYTIQTANKTGQFPNNILRPMSYSDIIFFDNPIQYNKAAMLIQLKFDIHLPRINITDSNDISEDISRRGFLRGFGAGVGLGAVGTHLLQPGSGGGDGTGGDDGATGPDGKPVVGRSEASGKVTRKYDSEELKQYIIDYAKKTLPPNQLVPFVAQVSHETGSFRSLEENLNYSAQTLIRKYPKLFNKDNVELTINHPLSDQIIANAIYSNRNGNGDYQSGDGYRYRGRGYIQLTGRENYRKIGQLIGVDLENNPDLASRPDIAAKAAIAFWRTRVANKVNTANINQVTKKISGSSKQGIKSRREKLKKYAKELGGSDQNRKK